MAAAACHSVHSQRAMEAITFSQAGAESFESMTNTEDRHFPPIGKNDDADVIDGGDHALRSGEADPVLCATT